jgi:hypothetical protein
MASSAALINTRLTHFVDWIKPTDARIQEITAHAQTERVALQSLANAAGLRVTSTPSGGSFAKNTGLRRHVTGGSDVEGLDVDLHLVIAPKTRSDEDVSALLPTFEVIVAKRWPEHTVKRTRSSIKLSFKGARLSYDIVPMLGTDDPNVQILLRSDGQTLKTSVARHVEFIKTRTNRSNRSPGRVKFNECVRLIKWWREFKAQGSTLEVPSLALELLCAAAFDSKAVKETYHETLLDWFDHIATLVSRHERVAFSDFQRPPAPSRDAKWELLDAVNPQNNLAARWSYSELDLLGSWFTDAARLMREAIRKEGFGDHGGSLHALAELFGPPFKSHCDAP